MSLQTALRSTVERIGTKPLIIMVGFAVLLYCVFAFRPLGRDEVRTYTVMAEMIRWNIDVSKIECLSLNKGIAKIYGEADLGDPRILSILERLFPNTKVTEDGSHCAHVLDFNIIRSKTRAVTYFGQISEMLMTFQICERSAEGAVDNRICSYKNLYLFRSDLAPMEAFEVGLRAFLSIQQKEWETIVVSLPASL